MSVSSSVVVGQWTPAPSPAVVHSFPVAAVVGGLAGSVAVLLVILAIFIAARYRRAIVSLKTQAADATAAGSDKETTTVEYANPLPAHAGMLAAHAPPTASAFLQARDAHVPLGSLDNCEPPSFSSRHLASPIA
jgi:hypothetical protein